MALFGKLFGGGEQSPKKEDNALPWKALNSLEQLDTIVQDSNQRPQLIFKHSTTCGISGMVLRMITNSWKVEEESLDLYFLDLHAHREISNEVAIRFQVIHESPQLLVIKNDQTVFNTSHGAISSIDIQQFA